MTDDEKTALEWLDNAIHRDAKWESVGDEIHRTTIKAMLKGPKLPDQLPPDAKEVMRAAFDIFYLNADFIEAIYRALYVHLTKPKTKEVEVWRVEYAQQADVNRGPWLPYSAAFHSQAEAQKYADDAAKNWDSAACIRVTGPHKQTVPA